METSRSREEGSCLQVCTLNYDTDSLLEAGCWRRSGGWTETRTLAAAPGPAQGRVPPVRAPAAEPLQPGGRRGQ